MASKDTEEGIVNANGTRFGSLTRTTIVDLICEGEIEGLVSTHYEPQGTKGKIGFDSMPINNKLGGGSAGSVYFNNVPVVDAQGLYNFQKTNITFGKGEETGLEIGSDKLGHNLEKGTPINEPLRGPTSTSDEDVAEKDTDYFAKYYRVLNRDVRTIKLVIKLNQLHTVDKDTGNMKDNTVRVAGAVRPLFMDSSKQFPETGPLIINPNSNCIDDALGGEFKGRVSTPFLKEFSFDLSATSSWDGLIDLPNFIGWEVKVWRVSEESIVTDESSSVSVDSIIEVYTNKFSYPKSAICVSDFTANYFSQVPQRAYDVNMLKVKIPSNYDPITRTYFGDWDGTFSTEKAGDYGQDHTSNQKIGTRTKLEKHWTSNPAWCYYDLLTNPIYGLGKYMDELAIDKWTLYEIGRYCDEMVDNGYDGVEPRFECNVLIQSREDAFKVIQDMSSVFRGLSYYAAGQIYGVQDKPKEAIYQFNNSNVQEGEFVYSNTSRKQRHNVAIIRYNDKLNMYKPAIEYTEDIEGIRKNGIRETEITAFGCASRGQALRMGKWILLTENLETETVSFTAGVEASLLRPGDVISVSDNYRHNLTRQGGRVSLLQNGSSTEGAKLWLDSSIRENIDALRIYKLNLLVPNFSYDPYNVNALKSSDTPFIRNSYLKTLHFKGNQVLAGDERVDGSYLSKPEGVDYIQFSGAATNNGNNGDSYVFQDMPDPSLWGGTAREGRGAVWTIEPLDVDFDNSKNIIDAYDIGDKYRVVNIKEEETEKFSISAIEYNAAKYQLLEDETSFQTINVGGSNVVPRSIAPERPSQVKMSEHKFGSYSKEIEYEIFPPSKKDGLASYEVYMKQDEGYGWVIDDFTERHPELISQFPANRGTTNISKASRGADSYIPNSKYIINRLSATSNNTYPKIKGDLLAPGNGKFLFKTVSVNGIGLYSSKTTASNWTIVGTDPMKDIVIKNLRLLGDTKSNKAGNIDNSDRIFEGPPTIIWNTTTAQGSPVSSQFHYRIQFNESALDNTDSVPQKNNITYITTGYLAAPSSNNDYSFRIPDEDWANIYDKYGSSAVRSLKASVQAHANTIVNGVMVTQSSAGGTFKPDGVKTSSSYGKYVTQNDNVSYSQKNGYDIVYLKDPDITPYFTPDNEACGKGGVGSTSICTTQKVNKDNALQITFDTNKWQVGGGSSQSDIEGGYWYYCAQKFTKAEIDGLEKDTAYFDSISKNPKKIQRVRHRGYSKSMTIPFAGKVETDFVYMAYSLYDTNWEKIENIYKRKLVDGEPNPLYQPDWDLGSRLQRSNVITVKTEKEKPKSIITQKTTFSKKASKDQWFRHHGGTYNHVTTVVNENITKPLASTILKDMSVTFVASTVANSRIRCGDDDDNEIWYRSTSVSVTNVSFTVDGKEYWDKKQNAGNNRYYIPIDIEDLNPNSTTGPKVVMKVSSRHYASNLDNCGHYKTSMNAEVGSIVEWQHWG